MGDVFTPGRMMTDLIHGPIDTVPSDGSHRVLGQASSVHEELGYRTSSPTEYKVMTVEPTRSTRQRPSVPQQPVQRRRKIALSCNLPPSAIDCPRSRQPSAVLMPSRPLRAACGGGPAAHPFAASARGAPSGRRRDGGMVIPGKTKDDYQ